MGTLFPAITEILTEEDLRRLREDYDRKSMVDASERAFDFFPVAAPYVHSVIELFYRGEEMTPRDRERSVIALLAASRSSFPLAVHFYWGLMEGLNPREIGSLLTLTGAYTGVDALASGGKLLTRTLTELKRFLASGEKVSSLQVLKHLASTLQ